MMRENILGVTLTCISAAIVKAAADDGASKKYIDTLCSLCVVCALVLPVFPMISDIDEYDLSAFFDGDSLNVRGSDGVQIYNGYLQSVSVEQAESLIETELCSLLDAKAEEVELRLLWEDSDGQILLTEAVVYLSGGAVAEDPSVVKDYIEKKPGVNCRIIY